MGKREFIACFSILPQLRMAMAWHPKGLRIARAVSDLCRIIDELADHTFIAPKSCSVDGSATL